MTSDDHILFYDIECFKYDSLVVFKDINNNEIAHFWSKNGLAKSGDCVDNGFEHIADLLKATDPDGHKQWQLLCGWNNYNYDNLMLYGMVAGYNQKQLKKLNDDILNKDIDTHKMPEYKFANQTFESIDTIQDIKYKGIALKQYEANKGASIIETEIDFDIDRPLTKLERKQTLFYCRYDVEQTIAVYKQRKESYFAIKDNLLSMLSAQQNQGVNEWTRHSSQNTLACNIIMAKYTKDAARYLSQQGNKITNDFYKNFTLRDYFAIFEPETIDQLKLPEYTGAFDLVPKDVWTAWKLNKPINYKMKMRNNVEFVFGLGGGHGTLKTTDITFKNVINFDVSSMYPSILINLGYMPPIYETIKTKRIEYKRSGDTVRAEAYKLVLNAASGKLRQRDGKSKLKYIMAGLSMCAYGQIALVDACDRLLKAGYTPINVNTDGIYFIDTTNAGDKWREIKEQWENDYNFATDAEFYDILVQKDVNSYCAIHPDGTIKAKGDLKNYLKIDTLGVCDVPIKDKATTDFFLKQIPIEQTITDYSDNPLYFQMILKAGAALFVVDEMTGNKVQNVNRVFAVKPQFANASLKKMLNGHKQPSKFPNAPLYMKVFNDDLSNYKTFKDEIDIDFYINLINDNIKRNWRQ